MIYLDTSVLAPALVESHINHPACYPLVLRSDAMTSAHALAETFTVLTAVYRVANHIAAESLRTLAAQIHVEPIPTQDYFSALDQAQERGVMGGLIYDSIHACVARRFTVTEIFTYNLSNFRHVAPDLNISPPKL